MTRPHRCRSQRSSRLPSSSELMRFHVLLLVLRIPYQIGAFSPISVAPTGTWARQTTPERTTDAPNSFLVAGHQSSSDANAVVLNTNVDDVFTEETCDFIAEEVKKHIVLPLVPPLVVNLVIDQVVDRLFDDLSPDVLGDFRSVLAAESTYTELDDVEQKDLDHLRDKIASELNEKMDIPLLTETQELEVLQKIIGTMLQVLTTSKDESREDGFDSAMYATQMLLESEESRSRIVEVLNSQIDVPFVAESDEGALIAEVVGNITSALRTLLPTDLVRSLKGEGTEGLAVMKSHLVTRIEDMTQLFPVLLLTPEKKRWLISNLVDVVVDELAGDTDGILLLMDSAERKAELLKRQAMIEQQMQLSQTRFEREQEILTERLESVKDRLKKEEEAQ